MIDSYLTGYKQEYLKLLRLKGEVPVGRRGFTSAGTYVLQSYSLLTQEHMSQLFGVQTAQDGKNYQVRYYNLDAIISVGYCVNSSRATQRVM